MSLAVGDFSRFNGPAPDYSAVSAVILNCTPENIYFQAQYKKAVAEGKLIGYYSWPLAFGPTGGIDGAQCAIALQGLHPGPVFYDIESGSYSGDPVSLSLAFVQAIQSAGRGAHLYVQGGLIAEYDFTPLVKANAGLWVAQYSSALTVSLGAWSQVGALGWQFTSLPYDQSQFFIDAAGWAAISVPPGIKPDSGNVTPITEDPMFLARIGDDPKVYISNGVWYRYIGSPDSITALVNAGIVPSANVVSVASFDALGVPGDQIPQSILNLPLPRQGGQTGQVNLAAFIQWSDSNFQSIRDLVKAVPSAQVTLTDAQVTSLAATLKAELPAAQIQALAAQLQK